MVWILTSPKIDNDPRRQLYVLDKALSEQHRRERTEFDQQLSSIGGILPTPRRGRIPNASPQASAREDSESNISSPKAISTLGLQDSNSIRAKIINATAMGQLGIPLKQWMVGTNPGQGISPSISTDTTPSTTGSRLLHTTSSPASVYMPERRIIMKDLLSVLSMDSQLSRSSTIYRILLFFHSPLSSPSQ